ncbi:hypothetical protein HYS30_01145, partial [Candidatus Peregrinibacteria bacterium]|nr:hypothetical protein [Candidatus Peregrinibacteria bacterium]
DSFLEAKQVEEKDRFSDLTEKGNPKIEQISLGLDGAHPVQELQYYRHIGRTLQPDITIMSLYIENDLIVKQPEFELMGTGADLRIGNVRVPPPASPNWRMRLGGTLTFLQEAQRLIRGLKNEQFLKSGAARRTPRLKGKLAAFWNETIPGQKDLENNESWKITLAAIRTLRDEVQTDGGKFLVLLIPSPLEVQSEYFKKIVELNKPYGIQKEHWNINYLHDRIVRELQRMDIFTIDPRAALIRKAEQAPVYFEKDAHLNEAGHRIVADHLLRTLLPLIPTP